MGFLHLYFMKFYCVLFDSMPFDENLKEFSQKNSLDFHHQVSCSFTFTSIFSLLTGLLPSQVWDNGFGYNSEPQVLEKDSIQLFQKLDKNKWDIYSHNSVWIENVIFNKFKLNRSTSIRGGIVNEICGAWCSREVQNLLCQPSDESSKMMDREIEHIKNIQSNNNNNDKNEFHFLIYHHHHEAINTSTDTSGYINDSIKKIMNAWDFEEKDAVFWFFSDHGNFKKIDKFNSPPHAWTTWVLSKDNIKNRKSNHGLISILDFIPSFCEEFGIDKQNDWMGQSIYDQFNKERTFFLEDSRADYDLYNSTTSCAISCKEWENNMPLKIEQTSYFLNENNFKSINFDHKSREIFNGNIEFFDSHVNKMKNLFKWM